MLVSCTQIVVGAENDSESNKNALELFGFPLDPDSYDTQALKGGTYPLSPKYNLYWDNVDKTYIKAGKKVNYGTFRNEITDKGEYTNKENTPYSATTGFAATSTGVEDHIAKVYFSHGRQCAHIYLSVYDANGNAIVTGYNTGGYVTTTDELEMWEAEGLLSVSAGDFDGDGIDEIAVYTPNNANETTSGSVHSNISVGIFEFDKTTKAISLKRYLDLASKSSTEEICEWEYSHNGSGKQFYCIPYVAFGANDLNKDGIDDLSVVLNFSTWYRGAGSYDTYTTKKILDHNTCFASVLELYEGTQDGNFNQAIKHRVLATTPLTGGSSDNTEHRFILRNANITVGDVTKEGSQEIIIAGNYTRVDVKNTADDSTKVGSNRMVEVDGDGALCHIVGYTTYENLKKHNTYDLNSDYYWTVQRTGNGWTYWYNEDTTDSGPITTSLSAFKYKGTGYPDTIFVGGQFFDFNSEEGKLKFSSNYEGGGNLYNGSDGKYTKTSVVWIGGSVAGNLSDDVFGREMLVFPFYYKESGGPLNCKLFTLCEATSNSKNGGESEENSVRMYAFEDAGEKLISLSLLDREGKTSYLTYGGNDTEVYYSDVEVLAIMQAPPVYEEIVDDDYLNRSVTSFEKSESISSGTTNSGTFSFGVVAGFEYKGSFLGIFPCIGAEYEFSVVGSVTHGRSVEKTYTYATGFETSGTKDAVTVFTVPYVRYNCSMYMPEYKLPAESDYNTLLVFKSELEKNLENCLKTGEEQITGSYVKGCEYYEYKYSTYVTPDNYQEQQGVLQKVAEEITYIEHAIESFGKGGMGEWGGVVEGAVVPYNYSVAQTPMLTTVDVATYDSIAEFTPGLEKIYGNVFDESYRAGDPNTYAKKIDELNTADGKVVQSEQSSDSSNGFLSNTVSPGTTQSQTISVDEAESTSIGWGVAVENSSIATVSVVKAGFKTSLEQNASYITTNTKGHTYSGTQAGLPESATNDYSYDWKLVSYNAKLNGTKVPVVGYIVNNNQTPPPSIAKNIEVKNITDSSATITWEDGGRPADYYTLSRVYVANGKEYTTVEESNIKSINGKCSCTINALEDNKTTHYVLESYMNTGKYSVPTEKIIITTFPENFSASIRVSGMEDSVIYRNGKAISLSSTVTGNEGYETYYQWQLDTGDGWENIHGQTAKNYKFTISPLDNGKKVRCNAVVIISEDSAYTLYSEPIEMNCARTDGDYQVDWEDNKIKITNAETAESVMAFIRVLDSDGNVVDVVAVNGEADLSEYMNKEYDLRLFIWKDNMAPETHPFER